jgi:uncharacterized membrane protein YwaF
MVKLVLMSALLASFLIPAIAARDRIARRGFKRAVVVAVLYAIAYGVALTVVTPQF